MLLGYPQSEAMRISKGPQSTEGAMRKRHERKNIDTKCIDHNDNGFKVDTMSLTM